MLENYDPNNSFDIHTVELTFQQWNYKKAVRQCVRGNCKGFDILESALENYAIALYEEQGQNSTIVLSDENGDNLICEFASCTDYEYDDPDELDIEEFLRKMLVKVEIIGFKEDEYAG